MAAAYWVVDALHVVEVLPGLVAVLDAAILDAADKHIVGDMSSVVQNQHFPCSLQLTFGVEQLHCMHCDRVDPNKTMT